MRIFYKRIARFVKTDVAVKADAQKLEVNSAKALYASIVFRAFFFKVSGATVGNKGIFAANVDVVKKVLLHKKAIALLVFFGQTYIFVQIDGNRLAEVNIALVVPINQLAVNANGRGACCQAQYAVGLHNYLGGNNVCRLAAELIVGVNFNKFHVLFFLYVIIFLGTDGFILCCGAVGTGNGSHYTAKNRAEIILVGVSERSGCFSYTFSALQQHYGMPHLHFGKKTGNAHARIMRKYFFQTGQTHAGEPCNILRGQLLVQVFT